jgi:P-type conjugative transfer protein TrbJ
VTYYGTIAATFATKKSHVVQEKQVSMVENQLTPISDMTKHGLTISDQLFRAVASDIVNLRQIVNTGQALSYPMSSMDGVFKVRFPGYSSTTNYG